MLISTPAARHRRRAARLRSLESPNAARQAVSFVSFVSFVRSKATLRVGRHLGCHVANLCGVTVARGRRKGWIKHGYGSRKTSRAGCVVSNPRDALDDVGRQHWTSAGGDDRDEWSHQRRGG